MHKRKSIMQLYPILYLIGFLIVGTMIVISHPSTAGSRAVEVTPATDQVIGNLADLNQALVNIAAHVKPTVVTVSTDRIISAQLPDFGNNPLFNFFFGPGQQAPKDHMYHQQGLGSGIIVSGSGDILTNNHVIDEADSIYVRTYDGRRYSAKVVGVDPKTDIAILKIDADGLPYLDYGNSDLLQVGEIVLAIGSPMSENLAYTVTQGIVSATGRSNVGLADYEDFIQTDAAINPGNSGGPLVDINGKLVGVNTAIASRSGGFQGIGFAVPSNMAFNIMTSLLKEGKVVRGWLGVSIQNVTEDLAEAMGFTALSGALVSDVVPDSPADDAGLKTGDLITSFDGKTIESSAQLRNDVAASAPGTITRVVVQRDGKEKTVSVKLGELPNEMAAGAGPAAEKEMLGFSVAPLTDEERANLGADRVQHGVVVSAIDPQCNAYQAGIRDGDIIQSVDRQPVDSPEKFYQTIQQHEKGDSVLLSVFRGTGAFFVVFGL